MSDSQENNKCAIRRFIDASNRHDLDEAWRFVAENCRVIPLERFGLTPDGATYKQFLTAYFKSLPDVQFELDDLVAENDCVWLRYVIKATHEGPFHGIPATNKGICYRQVAMYRLRDAKIIELDVLTDDYSVFKQLGTFPSLASGSPISPESDTSAHALLALRTVPGPRATRKVSPLSGLPIPSFVKRSTNVKRHRCVGNLCARLTLASLF